MEHIEPAGIHSGDANIVLPPVRLSEKDRKTIEEYSEKISKSLGIVGMVNIQYVAKDNTVYVLEANPRASRTIPYVSKTIGIPLAKIAVRIMMGEMISPKLKSQIKHDHYSVKSVVFPFLKLGGTDINLGPEMRSTGETMGLGKTFEMAYYKALLAAGIRVKEEGAAFISLKDEDKKHVPKLTELLKKLGYRVYGTMGTVGSVEGAVAIPKIGLGKPDILELIESKEIAIVINSPTRGGRSNTDGFRMRRACIQGGIPCITNVNPTV
jgi:carbamoyl-phosphate synthase large subunit